MLAIQLQITLLGAAAIITAIWGVVSTIIAVRRGSRGAQQDELDKCLERLNAARAQAEKFAQELHDLKMRGHDET